MSIQPTKPYYCYYYVIFFSVQYYICVTHRCTSLERMFIVQCFTNTFIIVFNTHVGRCIQITLRNWHLGELLRVPTTEKQEHAISQQTNIMQEQSSDFFKGCSFSQFCLGDQIDLFGQGQLRQVEETQTQKIMTSHLGLRLPNFCLLRFLRKSKIIVKSFVQKSKNIKNVI